MKINKKKFVCLLLLIVFKLNVFSQATVDCEYGHGYVAIDFAGDTTETQFIFMDELGIPEENCWDRMVKVINETPDWLYTSRDVVGLEITCFMNKSTAPDGRQHIILIGYYDQSHYIEVASILVTQSHGGYVNWYPDSDGDGFGDCLGTPEVAHQDAGPSGYVTNNEDHCPQIPSTLFNGCEEPYENINWTQTETYTIDGTLAGKQKSYFNALGNRTQTQLLDVKEGRIWANQTLYDSHGRPALQTLSAPITAKDAADYFEYKADFIKNQEGTIFTRDDYEDNVENPATVSSSSSHYDLGWYTSEHNSDELLHDQTDRPYSRTLYSELNPGTVLKTIGGNKLDTDGDGTGDTWKQGFSYTFPAAQEMYYAFGKDGVDVGKIPLHVNQDFVRPEDSGWWRLVSDFYLGSLEDVWSENPAALHENQEYWTMNFRIEEDKIYYLESMNKFMKTKGTPTLNSYETWPLIYSHETFVFDTYDEAAEYEYNSSFVGATEDFIASINWLRATKTVVQDIHGVESVVFTDTDGKTLASASSGGATVYEVLSLIGKQKFIDIHIPVGCEHTVDFVGATAGDFRIWNLRTEQEETDFTESYFPAGFYRIEYVGTDLENLQYPAYTMIDISNSIVPALDQNIGLRYKVNYYDYALQYYDKAGRLVKSTQPLGFDSTALEGLQPAAALDHTLAATYTYNALGQLTQTSSPDEGTAQFKYRKDGQIRFSQHSIQKDSLVFSYTNYDALGRPIESGVAEGVFETLDPDATTFEGTKKMEEKQETVYDQLGTDFSGDGLYQVLGDGLYQHYKPTFYAGKVVATQNQQTTTWYSYDIYGRVRWLVQDIEGLGVKTIDYSYHPILGTVTHVDFQKHVPEERFVHRYAYDELSGELLGVSTSEDAENYEEQAAYHYYENGALKRLELYKNNDLEPLQGIDYVYNLAGQLKAINHPSLEAAKDPGGDADDAFGMYIDYYRGDYQRENAFKSTPENSNGIDQYNGNIKALTWSIRTSDTQTVDTYYYKYTKENWLEAASFNTAIAEEDFTLPEIVTLSQASTQTLHTVASEAIVLGPGFHFSATDTQQFSAKISSELSHSLGDGAYNVYDISYDANGNIQTLHRNKDTENGSPQMDALTYVYDTIKPNQLQRVEDAVTASIDADDLKNQTGENYRYNALGQLVENKQDSLLYAYTASGLVSEIQKNNLPYVKFYYNDKGFRVRKETYHEGNLSSTQYYVRDAAGSVMAIYNDQTQAELPIYGAKRLGVFYKSGSTQFELTDHLGNVRAVVEKSDPTPSIFADYYPGGMQMPNRNVVGDYRYNYQGQELDPETGKVAFEARLYDPRINRWLTVDPAHEFFSPYLAMGNNWINTIDPDGRCTDCPNNAKVGDTYNHPDYGEVTFSENGWSTADGIGILDDIVLGANTMTPFDVGVEWLTGTGPAHRDFFAGDNFTEMIKTHSHVKDTEDIIGRKFANGQELLGVHRYRLNGIEGVGKYVKDYSTLLTAGQTGNLAVTYLGTYSLEYSISDVDVANRTMRIHFTVHNESDIESATRPPVIGYEPIWSEGPGKWINSAFQTGPMSPKTQAIHWSSTIKY